MAAISAGLLLLPAGSAIDAVTAAGAPIGQPSAGAGLASATPPSPADSSTAPSGTTASGSTGRTVTPAALTTALPDQRAKIAIEVAMKQIGLPYVWGGNGPESGHRGFDCSGLTTFSYDKAGVELPRTAHTQFRHGPRVPSGAPLQPGDLVFYGTYAKVHHVGMYIGSGRMVNAPTFGKPVQTAWYRYAGDDYIGASRPAATGGGSIPDPAVPERPDPAIPDVPEFTAPPAPPLPATPDPRAPQLPEPQTAALSLAAAGPVRATPPAVRPPGPAGPPVLAEGSPDRPAPPVPPAVSNPGPAPSTPTAPNPRPTPGPTTPQPSSPATPAPPPPTSGPMTPTPPTATRPTPPPSSDGQADPAAAAAVALVDAGTVRSITEVRRGADGLPVAPGVWAGPDRWVVRLATPLAGPRPGTSLVVRLSDGSTRTLTVRSTQTVSTAVAAASTAKLVVVVPKGAGQWTLTTAG